MDIIKSIKKNTIVLLLITILVLYFVLKDDFSGIVEAFKHINIIYILIGLVLYLLSVSLRGYVNYLIINDKEKISLKEAIKHNFIAQFFNGKTPFSTGGQTMEIYMIREHNISIAKATNYTIQSFIFYQIALVICGLFAVTYNFIFGIFPKVELLQHLVLLGFIINILAVLVLIAIAYSKKATKFLSNIAIKSIKIVKKDVDENTIKNKFEDFYKCSQDLKNNKKLTIIGILLNIISLSFLYAVPLLIIFSLGDFTSISLIKTITASAYVYLIGAFVPIPGASGGMEYGYNQFFGNFLSSGPLAASLLLWRFITYYLGMIVGALLFSLEKKEDYK